MSNSVLQIAQFMMLDIDIYRSAHALIDQHGNDAEVAAAQRADQLLSDGDMDGHRVWVRIVNAVKELLNKTPEGAVH